MAAAAILEKFRMAISPQRLTIYLYSAHRAVIFAIAQLSCIQIYGYGYFTERYEENPVYASVTTKKIIIHSRNTTQT